MASLTLAQKQTLKAFILADPVLGPLTSGPGTDLGAIATALSSDASPAFVVWKTSIKLHDVTQLTSPTGTTFTWGGTAGGYINRSQGERDCWQQLWNSTLSCNPSLANVRTAFSDIFSGAGAGAVNNRAHLLAMAKRNALVVEKVFATGTGSDATPAMLVVEGGVNIAEVSSVLAS